MRYKPISDEEADALVESGEATLLQFKDGKVVVQKVEDSLHILLIKWGKEPMDTKALNDVFLLIAQQEGCTEITGGGRKGWTRRLKPFGYEVIDGEYCLTIKSGD